MRLLIFGDSFAADTTDETWTRILADKLSLPLVCHARGGASLFYIYQKLKQETILPTDTVVLVLTSSGRLYTGTESRMLYGNLVSALAAVKQGNISERPFLEAIIAYYTHLQNQDFDQYVHNSLTNDISNILRRSGAKHVFLRTSNEVSVPNLLDIPALIDVIARQNEGKDPRECDLKYKLTNHLSPANQKLLAKCVYNYLKDQPVKLTLDNFSTLSGRP